MTKLYNIKQQKMLRRGLRQQEVSAEQILWSKIRNRQLDYKFRRQYGIGKYIVDFYCPEARLVIEIDGATHNTNKELKKDKDREDYIKSLGIKIRKYTNIDIFENLEAVLEDIYNNLTPPLPAGRQALLKDKERESCIFFPYKEARWVKNKVNMNLKINKKEINVGGIRLSIEKDGKEVARAFLYLLTNDLHEEPFGFLEDVFVNEEFRGQGIGTELINKIVETAKENNCYKILATSRHERPKVHALYERLGFKNHGLEFRMNLDEK